MGSFSPPQRHIDTSGKWALFQYDGHPAAQLFVPLPYYATNQFSFFWLGTAAREDIHAVMDTLLENGRSAVEGQLIARSHISRFSIVPLAKGGLSDAEVLAVNAQRLLTMIDAAELPASIGITVQNNTGNRNLPSSCYFWASMGTAGVREPGEPEVGVKVSATDWQARAMRDIFFPILQRSSGIENEYDVDWLWNQVSETVESIAKGN